MFRLQCNEPESDFDKHITSTEPYVVQWFKDSETSRVEDKHANMWTYYDHDDFFDLRIEVSGSSGGNNFERDLKTVGRYDLVIFNAQYSDRGTYFCEAVARTSKKSVRLGSTTLRITGK